MNLHLAALFLAASSWGVLAPRAAAIPDAPQEKPDSGKVENEKAGAVAVERVEGRVVDMRGEPLAAVAVYVTPGTDPDTVLGRGSTDGEGRFVLGKVPVRDTWRVGASMPGRTPVRVWTVPGRGPVTVQLPEAVSVRGQLRDREGKPVPGASVIATLASARELGGARDLAVTDAEGHFDLASVPIGVVWLSAVVPGQNLAAIRRHITADATIDLAPVTWKTVNASIEITGLPADGPPPAAAVHVAPYNVGYPSFPPPWHRLPLDRHGRGELVGLPEWVCNVTPEIPGFVCQPITAQITPGQTHQRFIAMPADSPALRWVGDLRDGANRPVVGVGLELRGLNAGPRTTSITGDEGRWLFALPVATGSDVVIRALVGDWVLDVDSPLGQMEPSYASQYRGKADPSNRLSLRAIQGATVTGRVLRPDGKPATLVSVRIEESHPTGTPTWWTMAQGTTDLEGHYQLRGVHPRDRQVRIAVSGMEGAAAGEAFPLDQPGMQVALPDLQLAAPGTVEGDVKDAAGTPVPGLRVWLRQWDVATNRQRTGSVVEVMTDRAGRFRFLGVAPGGAMLQLAFEDDNPKSNATAPFEVEAGKACGLHLLFSGK